MTVTWAITPEKVRAVVERILQVSKPKKLILFGSCVRGNLTKHSDVDILVVAGEDVKSPRKEAVRIRRSLKGISMPMDILVVSEGQLDELANQPGLIYREALKYGEVVYESPG
jgi:predicted nucleotidyltransferase